MKKLLLLLLCTLSLMVANPTISNIAVESLDASGTARIYATISPASYAWVKYGHTSGVYPYSTQSGENVRSSVGFAMSGLKSGATYYFVIEARPGIDDNCSVVSTCTTSAEQSFTVPVATRPVAPAAVTTWTPSRPNTSGYTVVRMVRDNATGDCKAFETVSGTNPAWTVNANDTLQTVLFKVGYGTVIEFDQGAVCESNNLYPDPNENNVQKAHGYTVVKKTVDPLASGIDDAAHRWIVLRTKQVAVTDFPPVGTRTGPTWTKNAKIKAMRSTVYLPARDFTTYVEGNIFRFDSASPSHHYWFENLDFIVDPTVTAPAENPNLSTRLVMIDRNSGEVQANPPKYNVFDRIHMIGSGSNVAGTPHYGCIAIGFDIIAQYFALTNSYIEGIECTDRVDVTSKAIMIREGASGPYNFDNNFISGIGMGFYAETNDAAGVPEDLAFTRNLMYWPWSSMQPRPYTPSNNWDGHNRVFRQQWESKGCVRCKIHGNIIDGSWAYQNEGPAILINGNTNESALVKGNKDYTITSNLIRRSANGINCDATRFKQYPSLPDAAPTARVLTENNLLYDLGRHKYQAGGNSSSFWSNYLTGNCIDWVVKNNTFGWNDHAQAEPNVSYYPMVLAVGMGAIPASGFKFTDNVYYLSTTTSKTPHVGGVEGDGGNSVDSHPMVPNIPNPNNGTWKEKMDGTHGILDGGVLVPDYVWTGNIAIGGTVDTYAPALRDMTQNEVTGYSVNMPGSDTWVAGNTKAAREAAAGIVASADPRVAYGSLAKGANVTTLYSDLGVTQNITVTPGPTSLTFNYKAPDSRVCNIDTSPDGNTWTRTADAGGATTRSTTVNLAAGTYQYRVLCYYEQTNSYDLWASSDLTNGSATTGGEAPTPSSSDSHVRGKVIVRGKAVLR